MKCKKILFLLGAVAIAHSSFAKDRKVNYNKSAFSTYRSMSANQAAMARTTQNIKAAFPGWTATTDKVDGMFSDIYGTPISIAGSTNSEKARNCIAGRLGKLGVTSTEWKQVSDIKAPKADYINYTREINGHTVVFATMSMRFTKQGDLARIQMNNYGKPTNMASALTAEAAKQAAIKDLEEFKDMTITSSQITGAWVWFPIPSAKGYELRPSWHFLISAKVPGSVPLKLNGYVDAITGAVLYRTNDVKETNYDVTVKGMVYKDGVTNPSTLQPLPDIELQIGAGVFNTDTGGVFSTSLLSLPQSTTIPLAGLWSTVFDDPTATTPTFTDLVSAPGTTYTYPTTAPSNGRHVNAYYHVNRVHNFMKLRLPTFTGMDFSLPTNVDVAGGSCNAFYSGTDINFFPQGNGCASFANFGDVIYHEYGHGISDHFYSMVNGSTIQNGALNEANSDIWALSITRSPVMAKAAFGTGIGFIRRYDVTPQVYPLDLEGIDPHKDGQIIAGCWWDLGVNINSVDTMSMLFTDVYFDAPDGPDGSEGVVYQRILIDALMADDNDNNIHNGTPHYNQIVAAFARHGIYLEGDAILTHSELPNQPAGQPIAVSANLGVTTTDFLRDLTMYYRVNNTGNWNQVTMTVNGATYTATIPAQAAGNVVEYFFTAHDSLNVDNAYFPISCNTALPGIQASLPYQFGVGLNTVGSQDFETSATGWGITGNVGDNANSTTRWKLTTPGGTDNIWPNGDHTVGNGSCLVTGIESTNDQGVAMGTASAVSPIFDISTFSTPVISYYRWFSNEQGTENFKDDPWVVKIRDGSAVTNPWIVLEKTYQADLNWRRKIFRVSSILPATTRSVQLRFYASDSVITTVQDNGQSITVTGLDDVFIYDKVSLGVNDNVPTRASIYPSPADDKIQIVLAEGKKGTISMYNMTGQQVAAMNMEQNQATYCLNTKQLAAGQYSLVIQTEGNIQSSKVVVVHQ